MQLRQLTVGAAVTIGLFSCGGAAGQEPSEAQMKEAALYEMNHPPGVTNSDPITIKFFKKEGCENPTPRGYNCSFDLQVQSANMGAQFYNNITQAIFYMESGKWMMRPPF